MKFRSENQSWPSTILRFGIPVVISVGLCWLLSRDFDWGQMKSIISQQCRFEWILLGAGMSIFSHIIRAARWRIQLRALNIRPPFFALVLSIFGTYAVNLVFPRLGEVWRTGYISQREKAKFSVVFGSMIGERLADTCTVALLTLFTFVASTTIFATYITDNAPAYQEVINVLASPLLWLITIVAVICVWFIFTRFKDNILVAKIRTACRELWHGFTIIASMRGRGKWLLLTIALWGCYYLQLFVAFFAFDFTAQVIYNYGALAVLVAFVLSSISMGVPANGGIGPWQWAIIFALATFGVQGTQAAAFANLVMGVNTLTLIILGLFTFAAIAFERRAAKSINSNTSGQCQKS